MKNPTLVKRYTDGLAAALASPAEYELVERELTEFAALLESEPKLGQALFRPFLNAGKKNRIIREILDAQKAQPKTARFLDVLLRHGRLEILPDVLAELPNVWRRNQGVRSFEVRSVVPLRSGQKARLEAELARIGNGPVHCDYVLDPSLVGGLRIGRGNLVYDVSLKGRLEKMKDQISER
jgi:F-type H+-transporting ATPase subunit delta